MTDIEFIKNLCYNNTRPQSFNILLNIEHVICFHVTEEEEIDISPYSTESHLIQFNNMDSSKYSYFFYPLAGELMLELILWGWDIGLVSYNSSNLAKIFMRKYFIKVLSKYTNSAEKIYDRLIEDERITILDNRYLNSTFTTIPFQTGYDIENLEKIDLTQVTNYPHNTVIIDKDRSMVLGANYPFICLDMDSSINFSIFFEWILEKVTLSAKNFPKENTQSGYSATDNVFYIMGILKRSKDLIKSRKAFFLKQALDKVLHNENYYKKSKITKLDTPWLLSPLPEHNPKTQEFIQIGKSVLNKWNSRIRKND